jgi:uncharacterized protein
VPNLLAREKSPYLLQHADNPVNWQPWGDEAFAEARRTDRPVFLSVGYSTCHWCHVMERESFEDPQVGEVLNRDFVPIKVDREERPDVDRVYMAFVQAASGSGGWPMSVWLTPDLQPFYGGTYFPPRSRWGRPGFLDLLREISRLWREERDRVLSSAAALTERLRDLGRLTPSSEVPGVEVLAAGVGQFSGAFDPDNAGFGVGPKFPRPSELLFLFREHTRIGDEVARDMALRTLQAMAVSGMRDHVGGGFHRYAVDAAWRVPHFEKMLYDQSQLVLAYLEAAQLTGETVYAEVAEDTLEYVRRDMTGPEGGFYSAEDADSVPQGEPPPAHKAEGAFYVWEDREIGDLLGTDADVFRLRYGVLPDGNAPVDPQGEFRGKNLLYVARSFDEVARLVGRSTPQVVEVIGGARSRLFDARQRRKRPHLDDKVLACWNGLMIAAFARAARVLGAVGQADAGGAARRSYLEVARRAVTFIRTRLWNPVEHGLLRRYRDGEAAIDAFAEDYACLIFALLELFQADGDPGWLEWALELQRWQDRLFWDEAGGGWFSSTGADQSVPVRLKDDYDGAEPSASSVSASNLISLAHLTGDVAMSDRAARALRGFGTRMTQVPLAMPWMMAALSAYHAGVMQIVVVGERDGSDTRTLLDAVGRTYLPFSVLAQVEPGQRRDRLAQSMPLLSGMDMREGRATAYVCRNFACQMPTAEVSELTRQLQQ